MSNSNININPNPPINKLKYNQYSRPLILIEDNINSGRGQPIEGNKIKTQTPTPIRKLESKFFDNKVRFNNNGRKD